MIHTYKVSGMTCEGCQRKVESLLQSVPGVQKAKAIDLQNVTVEMDHHILTGTLKNALSAIPQYKLTAEGEREAGFWEDFNIWKSAGVNTFNCLIGCTIGDFAMIAYLQAYYNQMNMLLMMALAMIAGIATSILLETVILKVREKFVWKQAFQTAIGMSLLSMIVMELAENITDLAITGGQIAISDLRYWLAMLPAIAVGFIVPLPYNYYKLKKHGKACH